MVARLKPLEPKGALATGMAFFLENKLVVALLVAFVVGWGVLVAPFDWEVRGVVRDPVPVDAIPDTGENQQIIFTGWPGRSPQDVEDQVSYPLTVALLGVPGVKSIRSSSMMGFSSIFVIFDDDIEFYWSRSRLLEKLGSLPSGTLPEGVQPQLGPDATPLGQVFWYTLEGLGRDGKAVGGWDLQELRSIQDWQVRYALSSVEGVSEVASIGGYVQEYQIDVDPDALRANGVALADVFRAVKASNVDVGARTIEVNRAEYVVRGLGFIESLEDIEDIVVGGAENVPITVRQVATVQRGPALRRGALDKGGAEAVGGVVVVRYGANPLAVIQGVKAKIEEIAAGLPSRTLDDGTVSRVTVVPFYDRSGLIYETLETLNEALLLEILVTVIVVLVMVGHLGSAALISGLLPLAVLLCFGLMKVFGVDANIVALSGIAIAIGTMVDVGIVLTENILKEVKEGETRSERLASVFRGASEVSGAVLTAVLTTVISFLPVFTMEGAEGKLFKPLAYTKSFALIASIVVGLVVIPAVAHLLLGRGRDEVASGPKRRWPRLPESVSRWSSLVVAVMVGVLLARLWQPLGPERAVGNLVFALGSLAAVLLLFQVVVWVYEPVLRWCLGNKLVFLSLPAAIVLLGSFAWLGFERVAGSVLPGSVMGTAPARSMARAFPGLGKEFMPSLDEGSFLLMPVTMAHASIGEAFDLLQQQDRLIRAIPEVEDVVGKIGRVDSALDPAPISMVETVITYKDEYRRGEEGELVRQWRDEIQSEDDIWKAIEVAATVPGMTTASKLQPIETRRIMLQTGMRAPMGVKVYGPDLETIEEVALEFEELLKEVPSVRPATVFADRLIGKPYVEIDIDRQAIARYGLLVRDVQDVIEVAIGGKELTQVVEGRERYPVRVRYQRERRDDLEALEGILVPTKGGAQVPLGQIAEIRYTPGPQNIKSEETFLVAYVLFDRERGVAEVDAVEDAQAYLKEAIASGQYSLPAGVSYRFAGTYENQQRASAKLRVVLPLALFVIFMILYLQFRSVSVTGFVFSAVFVAWSGGFLMLWLYGQSWFLDVSVLGVDLRELFQIDVQNLSVAVWVGFLALFGIATDDGVLMATYIGQRLEASDCRTRSEVIEAVVEAGKRRIRPCLMTTATTTLALLPVLTSTGRGSDVMVPMAIPSVGGMLIALITIFVVPTLYCWREERRYRNV
ncbi:Cation efflux system protein CusA [Planctomycetes bacterium Poly30]|uniref:Cation efflux system protein CusA n=1 Tax=Saltatorellus ferox TaxID=2528018 RepID=A0A518EM82_9BACT|nr:Cation efflux system protein CusA [Planctomycetes bacterium Poly30]